METRENGGRTSEPAGAAEWIPDFKYEVIRLHDYSNRELLGRGDEVSLVMLFNKVQSAADLSDFLNIPAGEIDRIVEDSPEHVVDVLVKVMESLCFKIDASEEERQECVRKVRGRKMGYLFENMEKMSIQEERRKTEEQRKRAEEEHQRAEEQQKRAEEQQKRAEDAETRLREAEEMIRKLMGKV